MRTFVSRPLVRVAAALLFAFGLGSCTAADRTPTAASTAASGAPGDLLGLDLNVAGLQLLSCTVTQSYSASKTIGPSGGSLRVGPHTLTVPAGALSQDVQISASAPAGKTVQVHFEPEGLRFALPTSLTMSYSQCGLVDGLLLRVKEEDFDRIFDINVDDQQNILEVLPSIANLLNRTVTGKVGHFSNYALAD